MVGHAQLRPQRTRTSRVDPTAKQPPPFIAPQLATLSDSVPEGEGWLYEDKLDGYRILARLVEGEVSLLTRRGNDWTARFETIAEALSHLVAHDAYLDGEVVAYNRGKIGDFQMLQNHLSAKDFTSLRYFIFDLLWLDGTDLRPLPFRERRRLLEQEIFGDETERGIVTLTPQLTGDGKTLFSLVCTRGSEGIVAKRSDAPYLSARTKHWLKVKCSGNDEFVIGGFTRVHGASRQMGALLLGQYDGDSLIYCGRVGTGFSTNDRSQFVRYLSQLKRDSSPFAARVPGQREVEWVEPGIVVQVAYGERTRDGLLRHPSFLGIREDKPAKEVRYEKPLG